MKVAFPTNKGEKIAKHSSFCRSFLIIDTQTQERITISNPLRAAGERVKTDAKNPAGRHLGTGRIVSALLAEAGVDVYVCYETGEKFADRLHRAGITVHTTQERQIENTLNAIAETKRPDTDSPQGFRRGRGSGRGAGDAQAETRDRGFGRKKELRRGLGGGMRKRRCGIAGSRSAHA